MKRLFWTTFLLLGTSPTAFLLGDSGAIQPVREPESFELNQCALVQAGKNPKVYLTTPSGAVEALDVTSGKVLWHTTKASFVFLARGNRLLATSPAARKGKIGCQLEILDANSGNVLKELPYPEVMPEECAGEGINASFDEEGYTQNGHDYLIWIKKWWPTPGGANKGSDYYYPPGSSGTKQGGFEIDLLKSETLPLSGTFPVMTLRTQSNPWGGYSIEPFKVDDVTAQAAMEMRDNQLHLILRRWKGSESLPEVGLGDPPWNSCGVLICGDRRNVLGAWQNPDKKDPFTYHIGLFSTVTGEKISEMDATSWPSSAQLCGNYLVCYFPTRVFVMDISKGKEVWTQPIKDLTYRGPYPPTAKSPMTKPKQPDEP